MVKRSKALKKEKEGFAKEISEDRTIRDFIAVRSRRIPPL